MLTLTAQQIVGGFNRREQKALDLIYNTYYPDVCRAIRKIVGDTPETGDLASKIFLKLLKNKKRIDRLKNLKNTLYLISKSVCLDYKKKQAKREKSGDMENYYRIMGEQETASAEIDEKFDSLMYLAAAKIRGQQLLVFRLCYSQGLTNQEIAKQVHLSEKTVANMKTQALKILKLEVKKPRYRHLFTLLSTL